MYLQRHKKQFELIMPHGSGMTFIPSTYDYAESFQSLVKYLVKLRRDGDIDNDTFEGLVRQSAANFVEAEISERIDMIFGNKISLEVNGLTTTENGQDAEENKSSENKGEFLKVSSLSNLNC